MFSEANATYKREQLDSKQGHMLKFQDVKLWVRKKEEQFEFHIPK